MVFFERIVIKKILIFLLVLFFLCCCAYFILGATINLFFTQDRIQQIVAKNTDLSVQILNSKVKASADLSLVFHADKLEVSLPHVSSPLFSATDFNLRIHILPLIFKRVSLSDLHAKDVVVNTIRHRTGEFNFEPFISVKKIFPSEFVLKRSVIDIGNLSVGIKDEKNAKTLSLTSDKFFLNYNGNRKKLSSNINSVLRICDINYANCSQTDVKSEINIRLPLYKFLDSDETKFNISVKNFSAAPYISYLNEFSSVKFDDLRFVADFYFKSAEQNMHNSFNFGANSSDLFVKFDYNHKENIVELRNKANLDIFFSADKDRILISRSSFMANGLNFLFEGVVKDYKDKKRLLDIDLKVDDCDFIKFIKLIPAGVVVYKTDLINELIHANPYAKFSGELNISGNYLKPDINGNLLVNDIYLFKKPVNFATANVKCNFIGDKVKVDVMVPGPNSQYVSVKGYSELYGKQAGEYDVVSSDNVDLEFAHKYLIPVQRVIGFKLGPLPFMKLSGFGKINIKTKGTIYDAFVNGKFFGRNITASLEGLNAELNNGKIELDFNGKVIDIVNTDANINDGKVTIFGFADDYNNLNVTAKIANLDAKYAIQIAKTSKIAKSITGDLSFIKSAKGKTDITLFFKGKAKSLEGLDFLNYISPTGEIKLKSVDVMLTPSLPINDLKGKIAFSNNFNIDLKGNFKGSATTLLGIVTPSTKDLCNKDAKLKIDLNTGVDSMQFSSLLEFIKEQNYFGNNNLKFASYALPVNAIEFLFNARGKIKGVVPADFSKINYSQLSIDGEFIPLNTNKSKNIIFTSGKYVAQNSKIKIYNSHVRILDADFYTNGEVANFLKKPKANLKFAVKSFSLNNFQEISNYINIGLFKTLLDDFSDFKGTVDANLDIRNNRPYGKLNIGGIGAYNKKQQLPLELKSGALKFAGDKVFLDALNFSYGNAPIYFDAVLKDFISKKPSFNAMFSTNLNEFSVDKLINPYLTYPFKVKGEIVLKGRIKGGINNYSLISYLTLPKDTDITYMGANIGDMEHLREFELKADFTKNTAKISGLRYIKYIPSQNNKLSAVNMLKANGAVVSKGKELNFDNFRIVTNSPVTAKIFNILFKKSVLKQGLFTCDLNLNGNVLLPHAIGNIKFRNINIPLYSTKINDMDLDINKNTILAFIRGKSFDSDVQIDASITNKQSFPIVVKNIEVISKKTSLSQLIEGISQIPKDSVDIVPGQPIVFKPNDFLILKGHASADEVELYEIKAQNLSMDFSNPTGDILNIDNMQFDIADGTVKTSGNFDISSLLFDVNSVVSDCDANILSTNFLGLQNQIYGRTNAKINLKGKIPENAQELRLVTGRVNFSVNNGKMPKLGSLEYLLRAGNLIKSGIFGLTLNNLIEVLTPYKTGEFSAIKGSFDIHNGKISSLEIFSKGDNLSLFIYGGYDVINDNADIQILGRLSKKVSNVLGAAGNASLNTLLSTLTGNKIKEGAKSQIIENVNKIPLIEISGDDFRLFLAKINGKLNSDDYVKSFNWLN